MRQGDIVVLNGLRNGSDSNNADQYLARFSVRSNGTENRFNMICARNDERQEYTLCARQMLSNHDRQADPLGRQGVADGALAVLETLPGQVHRLTHTCL
jgi:hypothetical protein